MNGLSVRRLATEADWRSVATGWDRLLRDSEAGSALQSHAFLDCWRRHLGQGAEPFILAVFRGEALVAAAPLQLATRRIWGRRYRILEFLGMPNELDRPGLLVRTGDAEALDALLAGIAERRDEWDQLQLDELLQGSWLLPALARWARAERLWCRDREFHACPYLVKSGDWAAYLSGRSRHFRSRLQQARRRLERAGRLEVRRAVGPQALGELVDLFFEVESRSWKAREGLAAGSEPAYREFCRELLGAPGQPHTGHAMALLLDGRPVAATLGFSREGVYYSLQIAHDEAYRSHSPGTLLEALELEWFHAEGQLRRYEFLGGEVFNKRRWTETAVATRQLFIRKPGWHIALKDLSRFHVQPVLANLAARLRRTPREAPVAPFVFDQPGQGSSEIRPPPDVTR
jgi:CelD/BcsL family acetyltransferase involved in cellulose biosynthesis